MNQQKVAISADAITEHLGEAPTLEAFGQSIVHEALRAAAATVASKQLETDVVELDCTITITAIVDPRVAGGCYKVCHKVGENSVCTYYCWGTKSN